MTQPSSRQLEKLLHKCCRSLFQGSSLQEVSIGLGNAWVQNRQQAITQKMYLIYVFYVMKKSHITE